MDEITLDFDNRPLICEECGGIMIFNGLGTYICEKCNHIMLDDYGKVRAFLEINPGTSISNTTMATGVSHAKIRQMLKESRLQIAKDSREFLRCEVCGESIVCGIRCSKCEQDYTRLQEEEQHIKRKQKKIQGIVSAQQIAENGMKGFNRN